MSLVVSDSGPLHYLILCDIAHVLPTLFGNIIVPAAVIEELRHAHSPEAVANWTRALPSWATIKTADRIELFDKLGTGEREAISLTLQLKATHLLVDDRAARKAAVERGIRVVGTIGIIEQAAQGQLLVLNDTLHKLLGTNFRIEPSVVAELLERERIRKTSKQGNA